MKYSESLKKKQGFFQLVLPRGNILLPTGHLVMYVRENRLGRNRIGISVSKKSGKQCGAPSSDPSDPGKGTACRKNYFHIGYDMVVIARGK